MSTSPDSTARTPAPTSPAPAPRPMLRNPAYWLALVLLLGCAATLQASLERFRITLRKEAIYPEERRTLDRMPREVGPFRFVGERRETTEVEETLGTENYVSRSYLIDDGKNADGTPRVQHLEFHAAYYTGMIDTVPHVPDRCFVGAGMLVDQKLGDVKVPLDPRNWSPHPDDPRYLRMANSDRVYVTLPRDPAGIALLTTRFRTSSAAKVHAGYFFVANGGWVSSAEGVRLLAFDRNSKYAYYLKVQFSSDSVANAEELARLSGIFLDYAFGDLMRCVPDWPRVEAGLYPVAAGAGGVRPVTLPAGSTRPNQNSASDAPADTRADTPPSSANK